VKNISNIIKFACASAISFFSLAANSQAEPKHNDPRDLAVECRTIKDFKAECDYRFSQRHDIRDLTISINGKPISIKKEDLVPYEKMGQKTLLAILVDVSDPARRETIEKRQRDAATKVIEQIKPHQKIALYVFDSDAKPLTPFTSDKKQLIESTKEIKAGGLATELYKSSLSVIEALSKENGDRKGILILSDGKAEDRAYAHRDVIDEAARKNISFISIGYSERPQDTPFLQNLERLSAETYGFYANSTDPGLAQVLTSKIDKVLESGGRVTFNTEKSYKEQQVSIKFGKQGGSSIELSTTITAQDDRTWHRAAIDWCVENPFIAVVSCLIAVVLISLSVILIRRNIKLARLKRISASLIELSESRRTHKIITSAVRIGRGKDNDIALSNPSVSLHHAEIHKRREGGFYIVDLASTNGVFVNSEKVSQTQLNDGDIVELGEVNLQFRAN
jgi:hypothetical protein